MELTPEQKQALEQQKENCPFCQIIKGRIPSKKVYEDDLSIAILDINPLNPGHLLFMPKEHYPIMPLIPKDTFTHLFRILPEITSHLRKAMMARHTSIFIANGPAAGQQSTHFMMHIIPSDKPPANFSIPLNDLDMQKSAEIKKVLAHNLPLMMRDRSKLFAKKQKEQQLDVKNRLAELIEENPEFKKMLMENPEAVIAGLEDNPSLKPLFEGVDVHALSSKLKEIESQKKGNNSIIIKAKELSDDELNQFLNANKKLRDYLINDRETLKEAIKVQPKLQQFFEGTTPEEVFIRINQHKKQHNNVRRSRFDSLKDKKDDL